jgi:endogenous inhibitor of DNA gyrase (YacG/DUF329 family)
MTQDSQNHTFRDEGHTLGHFLSPIYVHCPNCAEKARITQAGEGAGTEVKLHCPHCHFTQEPERTYDREVKVYCPDCGYRIEHFQKGVKEIEEEIAVKCPACQHTHAYKPNYWDASWRTQSRDEATDPFFHLPLWLSGTVKKQTFWAYNYEHLDYLRRYISAKLRVRSGKSHSSMVEKLPPWMSSKKNRDDLIRLIEKLEKK